MSSKTNYFAIAFVTVRGVLTINKQEPASSEGDAIYRAEAWALSETGAAAICVTMDPGTGEVSAATILAKHGDVPDDLLRQISRRALVR